MDENPKTVRDKQKLQQKSGRHALEATAENTQRSPTTTRKKLFCCLSTAAISVTRTLE
jgi:hypothetical protein